VSCFVAGRGKRHFFSLLLCAFLIIVSLSGPSAVWAAQASAGEYQVKAAFLLNFANYVTWPDSTLERGSFTIGILGEDPFGSALDAIRGKTVKGKMVVIRKYDDPEEALAADILFISASEQRALPRIVKILRDRPVLTVGDQSGFGSSGVMINLLLLRKRVGFEINLTAAKRAGIEISSQLLKLAQGGIR
jgi:hypothetical protein